MQLKTQLKIFSENLYKSRKPEINFLISGKKQS